MSGELSVAVLVGGAGTRLRAVLADQPKVLAPINGRPFLFILLDQLVVNGAERIVLCTGYLGDQIRETVGEQYRGCSVIYSHEARPLGTGGALRQAIDHGGGDLWLVANGDSYIATPLADFVAWYRKGQRNGALLLTWVEDAGRFGTVEVTEAGLVRRFQEKCGVAAPAWINAGIYLLPRSRIETLPDQVCLSLEREVFPEWAEEGLDAYCVRASFTDIGTPESLENASRFFSSGGGIP